MHLSATNDIEARASVATSSSQLLRETRSFGFVRDCGFWLSCLSRLLAIGYRASLLTSVVGSCIQRRIASISPCLHRVLAVCILQALS